MKLTGHSSVCSKEYFHAAPLRTQKAAVKICSRGWRVVPHTVWNSEKTPNLCLRHALADRIEAPLWHCITANEENNESPDSKKGQSNYDKNFGAAFHWRRDDA
jgi:hypothetical protein